MLRVGFAIVLGIISNVTFAQSDDLFRPFDCREHAEFDSVWAPAPEITDIQQDTLTAVAQFEEPTVVVDTLEGWKQWSAVENYSFGKNRGSITMINDLRALHPFFRDRIVQLIELCKNKGIDLAVVETFRTHAKQHEYKSMGKKYTNSSAGRSRHQYGLAVDVVPMVDSTAVWDNVVLWRKVGVIGEKIGLRWGGRWRKPFDPGHFEWTGGLTSSHLAAGELPVVPESEHYPCLDEDIRVLRRYWTEWETSQSSLTRK
jgi:peptidoglycan L-alanyl-D-glutamate endopeptidase CwlK